ncbi:MAG: hypothetical protein ACJASF_000234 [Vicingaceae bacterium]|jgi:hypothetical protein
MLAVSTLLNQLTTMQQLVVENDLQSKVAYNSSTLSVYSSMLLGESRKEILASCTLDQNNYPKKERPIIQAILDFYGLKAENSKDQFLSVVYFAIHEEQYVSRVQKVKRLEDLFHQMKRYELEQESALLLQELEKSSVGTPLHAVYEHLFNKYHEMEINNTKAYIAFEKLNLKISEFLGENMKDYKIRDLIKGYKEIRSIHNDNENRVSECILNTSMLLLANYCGQTQLLNENKWTLSQLFETCKSQIENLPFSVERMFMKNIFDMSLKHAVLQNSFEINTLAFQRLKINVSKVDIHNFSLHIEEKHQSKRISKSEHLINNFVRSMTTTTTTTTTTPLSMKQNPMISSPNRI